jgi:hypothetical protein
LSRIILTVVPSPLAGGSPRNNEDEPAAGARCEAPAPKRNEERGLQSKMAREKTFGIAFTNISLAKA